MSVHPFASAFSLLTLAIVPGTRPRPISVPPPASSVTIPANEANAIRTLEKIAAAEQMFRDAVDIDTNCDRQGEYGYFAELAGTRPMRVSSNCQPAAGSSADILAHPLLPTAFGQLPGPPTNQGFLVSYKGYYFQIWLAGSTVGGIVSAIREDLTGGKMAPPYPDPGNGARFFIGYAWPIDHGTSGIRAFCINQRGFVLECANEGSAPFDGLYGMPWFDEALSDIGDLNSPLRVGVPGGAWSTVWEPVH